MIPQVPGAKVRSRSRLDSTWMTDLTWPVNEMAIENGCDVDVKGPALRGGIKECTTRQHGKRSPALRSATPFETGIPLRDIREI